MATYFSRSLFMATRQSLTVVLRRSYSASSSILFPNSTSVLCRLRPLVTAASNSYLGRIAPGFSTKGFATRPTTSSLNDPNPNWSNRPPKETILLDGCDFEHWLVVMEKPEGEPTRDEIIDSYIKTLAMVVGSEDEARMKIYSVSTRHYFAFGALVSEELSYKIKELPKVRWVLPDSYLDVRNKDYGGEPFINGQAVPYDPKYHEEWVRNNARANERNRRNDRPRNFDRSRNFERRRDGPMGNQNSGGPPDGNFRGQPNMGGQSNYARPNSGNYPPNNHIAPNNPPSYQGQNTGGYAPGPNNQQGYAPNMGPPQGHAPNMGGGYQNQYAPRGDIPPPPNRGPAPPQGQASGYGPGQNYAPNTGYQGGYTPNMGPGQGPNEGDYTPQVQNIPGRESQH